MAATFKVLTDDDIDNSIIPVEEFARDVFVGLHHEPRSLPSKYLYDTQGSKIYEQIMELPEYYLVRAEYEILETHRAEIAQLVQGQDFDLVELGAGNGYKTNLLLEEFQGQELSFEFVPIDISKSAMQGLSDSCNSRFPDLRMRGIVADYFDAMSWLAKQSMEQKFVLFLGSNIGNFLYEQAVDFLFSLWNVLNNGDLALIGFDLRKELDQMIPAYNDPQGVTAAFNLNLLERINRELGANFDLNKFRHYEPYDVHTGAMTSFLISMERQMVYIERLKRSFVFEAWEPVHIEQSYKYTEEDINNLAETVGFEIVEKYFDEGHNFCDAVWRVVK